MISAERLAQKLLQTEGVITTLIDLRDDENDEKLLPRNQREFSLNKGVIWLLKTIPHVWYTDQLVC